MGTINNYEICNMLKKPYVKNACKSKIINLSLYISFSDNLYLKEDAKRRRLKNIDLTEIENDRIIEFLCCYFVYVINDEIVHRVSSLRERHYYPLKELMTTSKLRFDNVTCFINSIMQQKYSNFSDNHIKSFYHFGRSLERFLILSSTKKEIYSFDIWYIKSFGLIDDRNCSSHQVRSITFYKISEINKNIIKDYILNLIENTSLSLSSIQGTLSCLKNVDKILNKSLLSLNAEDAQKLVSRINSMDCGDLVRKKTMSSLIYMIDYYCQDGIVKENVFHAYRNCYRYEYQPVYTAPGEYVIKQVFKSLNNIDEKLVVWFLIIYCTGCRIGEATTVKRDCISYDDKGFYLRTYQSKMKKYVINVIPKSLYELIEHYRSKPQAIRSTYLFPSKCLKDQPVSSDSLREKFIKEINKQNILIEDGSLYRFKAHSFRHLIATRMNEISIPTRFIQEQLHHESIEMTSVYIEENDKKKISNMHKFIDIYGNEKGIEIDNKNVLSEEEALAEYLANKINAQVLPDGICARPIKLGNCPHGNNCINCSEFRTSVKYLPVLKDQRRRAKEYLSQATKNNWIPQEKYNRRIIERLDTIIARIEDQYSLAKRETNSYEKNSV